MNALRRLWPLAVLIVLLAAAWRSGLLADLSWTALARNQAALRGFTDAHPARALAAFTALYAACVALSVPVGVLLTAASGLFFGVWLGTAATVAGATLGAVGLFLIVRHVLGGVMERRAGGLIARIRPRLERDGFSYLLALRLLPVVPFWVTNLAPALTGMRLLPYAAATFLGIIPASFVFAGVGAGLGGVLAAGQRPDLSAVLSPGVVLPLLGLALLALAPVAWRAVRGAAADA